jgi:hypothetical protein
MSKNALKKLQKEKEKAERTLAIAAKIQSEKEAEIENQVVSTYTSIK